MRRQGANKAADARTGTKTSPSVSALLDYEGDSACWFGAGEHLVAVCCTIHLEPLGQAHNYILPRDVAAGVRLEFGDVIAALNGTPYFETRLNGLLCRFHLFF